MPDIFLSTREIFTGAWGNPVPDFEHAIQSVFMPDEFFSDYCGNTSFFFLGQAPGMNDAGRGI